MGDSWLQTLERQSIYRYGGEQICQNYQHMRMHIYLNFVWIYTCQSHHPVKNFWSDVVP